MNLSFIKPRPELRRYIRSFWIFESAIGLPESETSVVAPNGCPKLIIPYENSITYVSHNRVQQSREQGFYFVGNWDSSTLLSTSARKTGLITIEFRPFGAYPFFRIPMGESANHCLDAEQIFNAWGRNVRERLRNQGTVFQKVSFIQDQLVELLRQSQVQNPIVEFCVTSLERSHGLIPIGELERKTGYSRRYLEILFRNHVGLSPKTLAGIFRFHKFYKMWAQKRPYEEIREELYDYYYDQAHFTKEFKRMTSFSPRRYNEGLSNEFGRRLILQ